MDHLWETGPFAGPGYFIVSREEKLEEVEDWRPVRRGGAQASWSSRRGAQSLCPGAELFSGIRQ